MPAHQIPDRRPVGRGAGFNPVFARKYALDRDVPDLDVSLFRPPRAPDGQLRLF